VVLRLRISKGLAKSKGVSADAHRESVSHIPCSRAWRLSHARPSAFDGLIALEIQMVPVEILQAEDERAFTRREFRQPY
jgi:hypothetical protein